MERSEPIRHNEMQPTCTREQARELLEALRGEYQALPASERWLVGDVIQAVVRGTSQAVMTEAPLERREYPRSEFGLTAIENVAYSVLRKTAVCQEVQAG